jgi:hypothetical protein
MKGSFYLIRSSVSAYRRKMKVHSKVLDFEIIADLYRLE